MSIEQQVEEFLKEHSQDPNLVKNLVRGNILMTSTLEGKKKEVEALKDALMDAHKTLQGK